MVRIYSDGSCLGNPGLTGAAWIIIYDDGVVEKGSAHLGRATNNVGELTAAIEGMKHVQPKSEVVIISDSRYVLDFLKDNPNKARANKELVKVLKQEARKFSYLETRWVKGHSGDVYNEEVDKMSREAAENPGRKTNTVETQRNLETNNYQRAEMLEKAIKYMMGMSDREFADKMALLFAIDVRHNSKENVFEVSGKLT